MIRLSVVVPVYRSQDTLSELCRRLVAALEPVEPFFEIILVEDCGGDHSWRVINEIAGSSPDAQLALAPLGRLIGEPDFGHVTRVTLSAFEGGAFGFALAWGLTARPRQYESADAHRPLMPR